MSDNFDATAKAEIVEYSDSGFWETCKKYAKQLGEESLRKILWLYYALESEACSAKHKTIIYGALAYLISPIDAIPDFIPFTGLTDDMGVIAAALAAVAMCIDEEVKEKAEQKMQDWFA